MRTRTHARMFLPVFHGFGRSDALHFLPEDAKFASLRPAKPGKTGRNTRAYALYAKFKLWDFLREGAKIKNNDKDEELLTRQAAGAVAILQLS